MSVRVLPSNDAVLITFPFDELDKNGDPLRQSMSRKLGAKWVRPFWKLIPTDESLHILESLCSPEYDRDSRNILKKAAQPDKSVVSTPFPVKLADFARKPRKHQIRALDFIHNMTSSALFMEMGTGKTKVAIDYACYLFTQKKIRVFVVVCPKNLLHNWADEFLLDKWPTIEHAGFLLQGTGSRKAAQLAEARLSVESIPNVLHIVILNYDALLNSDIREQLMLLVKDASAFVACDESTKIKNPQAKRTKVLVSLRDQIAYRMAMTGSPVTESPLDIYGQYLFVDPRQFGQSFVAFRAEYCIMGGYDGKEVVAYQNQDKFQRKLYRKAFRVLKSECLDLPPKIYIERKFEMSPEQKAIHDKMAVEMVAELRGEKFVTSLALTKILRLQEIASGYLKQGETVRHLQHGNPKIDEMLEVLDESSDEKVIIWCREHEEINLVVKALQEREEKKFRDARKSYQKAPVFQFHGRVSDKDKDSNKKGFIAHKGKAYFVGNPQSGGMGLTLVVATLMIFFSNLFSAELRDQAEDRAHRIGQDKSLTIVDLVAEGSIDEYVMKAHKKKKAVRTSFTESVKEVVADLKTKVVKNGRI